VDRGAAGGLVSAGGGRGAVVVVAGRAVVVVVVGGDVVVVGGGGVVVVVAGGFIGMVLCGVAAARSVDESDVSGSSTARADHGLAPSTRTTEARPTAEAQRTRWVRRDVMIGERSW
jgi:hypothetical protein